MTNATSEAKMTRWCSCAKWPVPVLPGMPHPEYTTDTHDTKQQAEGVCNLLRRYGFGGNCRLFPIETWIEPVEGETL